MAGLEQILTALAAPPPPAKPLDDASFEEGQAVGFGEDRGLYRERLVVVAADLEFGWFGFHGSGSEEVGFRV